MTQWAEYSTGERIKILRADIRQTELAEKTALSVVTIQKAEQDKALTLPTLLKIADALSVDASVILGQQAPRRAMDQASRAMLRTLGRTVHDTAARVLPDDIEPSPVAELQRAVRRAWDLYWGGEYIELGAVLVPLLKEAAAALHASPVGGEAEALAVLSDANQIAGCAANLLGARDLAYAAVGHARVAATRAGDPLRSARVDSAYSWVYLRDGRLSDSLSLAQRAADEVEPRYSDTAPERLAVYGNLLTHCAVTSARLDAADRAGEFLSQMHAVGARLGREHDFHGARFGPQTAATQAVGVNVTVGETGKALTLIDSIHERALGGLAAAARNRYRLDVAMAQADASMWDASLDTLEGVLTGAPQWARHQALPGVIVEKIGHASTSRLRRVAALVGTRPVVGGFDTATAKTVL
ncbi:helix-turn-helix domain-containing protein [Streptomyces violascens]|uniref:helix-turn-helix domain-containing protein n=1 Tax=Streptomyces violascens TaxID=67381 RepID=UPI00167BB0AC|nr:helix-turn-helix transcriptional regulator [Streptomyces violascens]